MAAPTPKQAAMFAAAFGALVVAVLAGTSTNTRNAARTRASVTAWGPGEPNAKTVCTIGHRWVRGRFLRRAGLAAAQDPDGGETAGAYCTVRFCSSPGLRPDLKRFDEDDLTTVGPQKLVAYDAVAAWPTLTVWGPGDNQDPSPCACSSGVNCNRVLSDGGTAVARKTGNTLGEGQWAGAGCIPKPCYELARGASSTPAGCL